MEKVTVSPGATLDEFQSLRTPFLHAFEKAYQNLSNKDLGVADKSQFLRDAFQSEADDFGQFIWFTAKLSERPIGAATFNVSNHDEIYVRQLWVDPDSQAKGVGKELVFSILEQYPQCKTLQAICRKLNPYNAFWTKIGFQPSTYMHTDYSTEKYTGFTWTQPRQKED